MSVRAYRILETPFIRTSFDIGTNGFKMTSNLPEAEGRLRDLLKRHATASNAGSKGELLCEGDIRLIAESLVTARPRAERSLAYLILSKLVSSQSQAQAAQQGYESVARAQIKRIDDAAVAYTETTFLQVETELEPTRYVPFTALLAALFPLDPNSSKSLLEHQLSISTDDKAVDDPLAVLLEVAELPSDLQIVLADMLAQAAGTKPGRELIRTRAQGWLNGAVEMEDNAELSAMCAVALSKLRQEVIPGQEGEEGDWTGMCDKMVAVLTTTNVSSSSLAIMSSVEGLAILSSRSEIKYRLASDPSLLKALIALCPVPRIKGGSLPITPRASMEIALDTSPADAGLCYGIATILVNLTSPKPVLSAEDEQVARLRAMALSGKRNTNQATDEDPSESPVAVKQRVRAVYAVGGVQALTGLVRADSRVVKEGLAKLCLNLVENKEDRMSFIRDGGFKVLSTVIRDLLPTKPNAKGAIPVTSSSNIPERSLLYASQALAKLVITTPPNLLFPPPLTTSCLDALAPLYRCLVDPSSTLLQQFESMMALTNLASIEPSIASRIVGATIKLQESETMWRGSGRDTDGSIRILHKVEECLISDNLLVRRAVAELICNLVSSQVGFEEYTSAETGRTESRLKLLLILSNSDDLATQHAIGGALAILTESSYACSCILEDQDRSPWTRVLGIFLPQDTTDEDGETIPVVSSDEPDGGSLHRAAIILCNLVTHVAGLEDEKRKKQFKRLSQDGVESTLMSLLSKQVSRDALEPIVETLKLLKRYPA